MVTNDNPYKQEIDKKDILENISSVTVKHLPGGHNQKRHGWRYGNIDSARRAMRNMPKTERDEYRKRAGMAEPKKIDKKPAREAPLSIESRMGFDEKSERSKIFKPNGLLQEGKTREDAKGFQKILETIRDAKGINWTGAGATIRDFVNRLVGSGYKPKRVDGEISLINASGKVVKIPKDIRKQAECYINFLHGKGEFSTKEFDDYENISFMELKELRHKVLFSVSIKVKEIVFKHEPGEHNQKLHGNRGTSTQNDFSVVRLNPNTVLLEVKLDNKTVRRTSGSSYSYAVVDKNGKIRSYKNPMNGKRTFEVYTRKSTAQLEVDFLNKQKPEDRIPEWNSEKTSLE